jgi:hypothetical protein
MGALRDCEAIVESFLGQPVNSLTALAFLGAGSVVLARTSLRWVGWALVATGVGSFLFHGPMPPGAEWIHDATLAWLLLVVAGIGLRRERWTGLPGLAALAAVLAAFPVLGDPVGAGLSGVAIGALIFRDRSIRTLGPMSLLVVVAVVGRLGATGGPLCDPDSILQPHGLWHLGAAAAVTWWALRYRELGRA